MPTAHVPLLSLLSLALALTVACGSSNSPTASSSSGSASAPTASGDGADTHGQPAAPPPAEGRAVAVFAGGCFWCMEGPFEELDGVDSVVSGYTGGPEQNPTYEQVGHGRTGHAEAVRVEYDPARVTYARLLEVFWHNIDPTQLNGQFCDRGRQYRTAIYVQNDEERAAAEASKAQVAEQLGAEVVTEVADADTFWVAEDYHQDFYQTNPVRYRTYRYGCGRDSRLEELWGEAAGH